MWTGSELFYLDGSRVMVVSVSTEPEFSFGVADALFDAEFAILGNSRLPAAFDVSADGGRFAFVTRGPDPPPRTLNVVLDWFEELKWLVPTGGGR